MNHTKQTVQTTRAWITMKNYVGRTILTVGENMPEPCSQERTTLVDAVVRKRLSFSTLSIVL